MPRRALSILVVAPYIPSPDMSSGSRRLYGILTLLAADHDVYIVAPFLQRGSQGSGDQYAGMLRQAGITILPSQGLAFDRAVLAHPYDVVIFEFWRSAVGRIRRLRHVQPWTKVIIDTVDVHFLREEAGLIYGVSDERTVAANKALELQTYATADAIVTVTDDDSRALAAHPGIPDRYIIPNIVPQQHRVVMPRDHTVLFVGGFAHTPNVDAVCWLAEAIWPSVKASVRDARLVIVGSNLSPEVAALDQISGVQVVGYVPDTSPYLAQAAVSVAPLRYGAGMKGKVTEALAAGVPVVTTRIGAQGLDAVAGRHLMIADDPSAFADSVTALLRAPDHAEELGRAGQKHIATMCGPEAVNRRLMDLLTPVATDNYTSAFARRALIWGRRSCALLRNRLPQANGEWPQTR